MYKDYENSYSQTLDNYTEMLKDPAFRSLVDVHSLLALCCVA
jgi:hypothetical protein